MFAHRAKTRIVTQNLLRFKVYRGLYRRRTPVSGQKCGGTTRFGEKY